MRSSFTKIALLSACIAALPATVWGSESNTGADLSELIKKLQAKADAIVIPKVVKVDGDVSTVTLPQLKKDSQGNESISGKSAEVHLSGNDAQTPGIVILPTETLENTGRADSVLPLVTPTKNGVQTLGDLALSERKTEAKEVEFLELESARPPFLTYEYKEPRGAQPQNNNPVPAQTTRYSWPTLTSMMIKLKCIGHAVSAAFGPSVAPYATALVGPVASQISSGISQMSTAGILGALAYDSMKFVNESIAKVFGSSYASGKIASCLNVGAGILGGVSYYLPSGTYSMAANTTWTAVNAFKNSVIDVATHPMVLSTLQNCGAMAYAAGNAMYNVGAAAYSMIPSLESQLNVAYTAGNAMHNVGAAAYSMVPSWESQLNVAYAAGNAMYNVGAAVYSMVPSTPQVSIGSRELAMATAFGALLGSGYYTYKNFKTCTDFIGNRFSLPSSSIVTGALYGVVWGFAYASRPLDSWLNPIYPFVFNQYGLVQALPYTWTEWVARSVLPPLWWMAISRDTKRFVLELLAGKPAGNLGQAGFRSSLSYAAKGAVALASLGLHKTKSVIFDGLLKPTPKKEQSEVVLRKRQPVAPAIENNNNHPNEMAAQKAPQEEYKAFYPYSSVITSTLKSWLQNLSGYYPVQMPQHVFHFPTLGLQLPYVLNDAKNAFTDPQNLIKPTLSQVLMAQTVPGTVSALCNAAFYVDAALTTYDVLRIWDAKWRQNHNGQPLIDGIVDGVKSLSPWNVWAKAKNYVTHVEAAAAN